MERTIEAVPCDVVAVATPVDLGKIARLSKPSVRVRYELEEVEGQPTIASVLADRIS